MFRESDASGTFSTWSVWTSQDLNLDIWSEMATLTNMWQSPAAVRVLFFLKAKSSALEMYLRLVKFISRLFWVGSGVPSFGGRKAVTEMFARQKTGNTK